MKTFITLLLLLSASFWGFSQYYYMEHTYDPNPGNPADLNMEDTEYPSGSGMGGGWTHIYTAATTTPTWSSITAIPFSFEFNGSPVTHFKASNTGVVTFDTGASTVPGSSNMALPHSSIPDKSVCVWGLLGSGSNDYISTKVFGSSPNRQLWIHYSSFDIPGGGGCWYYLSVVLEESTNSIFIVDQRQTTASTCTESLTLGVQVDGSTAEDVTGSPSWTSNSVGDPARLDNTWYEFKSGTHPTADATTYDISTPTYLVMSAGPFDIEGEMINHGSATITSMDVNYSIDGGSTITSPLTGLSIAPGATYSFTHPTPWAPSMTGQYDADVWISNINSTADAYTRWDLAEKELNVLDTFVDRKVLFEVHTSSTCGPCVAGNTIMKGMFDANPTKLTYLKYQMNWPSAGDPYYVADAGTRWTYNSGKHGFTGIPASVGDGLYGYNPTGYTTASLTDLMNEWQQKPAFITFDGNFEVVDANTVNIEVSYEALADISGSNRLHVALFEKETYDNKSTNGETEFQHVMMAMFPDGNGTNIGGLTKGDMDTKNFTINPTTTFIEDINDLGVVVWIQNNGSGEVHQSAYLDEMNPSSIVEAGVVERFNLFPNPSSDIVTIDCSLTEQAEVEISVFNLMGELIYNNQATDLPSGSNQLSFDVSNWNAGVYLVNLVVDGKNVTRKLNVSR